MRLQDNVYVVGGGSLGYDVSSPYDCNVYAVVQNTGVILIDAGSGMGEDALVRNLRADGLPIDRIHTLVLTHAHADHAGGASGLRARLGVRVLASVLTASIVEAGDEERSSLDQARKDGVYPVGYRYAPCPIDLVIEEGDCIGDETFRLQVIQVPGHSADLIAFYEPVSKSLFSGDVVFEGGQLAVLSTPDFSLEQYQKSIERLAKLEINRLYPGHGPAVLIDAKASLLAAQRRFEQGLPPVSIV
ncbi:MBL fold metallo-hydrolase [Paenibacillus cremeus]|uniref:MBL fold metallo-hydrolase n=1 Tax=Paenibacillus cremeus TaxID=2163881 RepID=A0A559K7C0_9BACL|nr:MBL fold metallo-hydrolase [Paenibacillus cremeus]TVY08030.1 MBL fold metallo-hydrolase [Paenibacillus cremeus]